MSFRMFFGWVKTLIIAVVALAGAAIIVLDAVMISGVNAAFATANVTVAAVSLAAAALIDVFALLLLFNSRYKLRDDGLYALLGVFGDEVAYNDIHRISVNAVTYEIFVAWRKDGEGAETVTRLNLTEKDARAMLPELERRCAFAVAETFTPPEKRGRKK